MKILWFADSPGAPDPAALMAPEHAWVTAGSLGEALFELEEDQDAFGACVICLPLRRDDPDAAVEEIQRLNPSLPIVMVGDPGAAERLDLLRAGAKLRTLAVPALQPA